MQMVQQTRQADSNPLLFPARQPPTLTPHQQPSLLLLALDGRIAEDWSARRAAHQVGDGGFERVNTGSEGGD